MKKMLLWLGALVAGVAFGVLGVGRLDAIMNFIAMVYTRLFQLLAAPTIVLAVTLTLASFGQQKETGRIFVRTLTYTLLTTFVAAFVGLGLYLLISPDTMELQDLLEESADEMGGLATSYYDHILSVIPNNIVRPLLEGNVLSLLIIASAVGIALSRLPDSEPRRAVVNVLQGLQDILFMMIRGLIWALPLGLVAFAAQLSAQVSAGVAAASLGKYVAVILGCNTLQFFVVLPLFLLARGINPGRTLLRMMPAVLMALFTKSSAATLPVTMESAENRMGVSPRVSRFVLPICTTINMNGCAAFILVTSLFVMQNGGVVFTGSMLVAWVFISVFSAIGNAGVPMGCYFLTLSLMSGIGAPIAIMGLILPIYTIIDMVETAENVWSDSCVCAMIDKDLRKSFEKA